VKVRTHFHVCYCKSTRGKGGNKMSPKKRRGSKKAGYFPEVVGLDLRLQRRLFSEGNSCIKNEKRGKLLQSGI